MNTFNPTNPDWTAKQLANEFSINGREWKVETLGAPFACRHYIDSAVCQLSSRVSLVAAMNDGVLYLATIVDANVIDDGRIDTAKEVIEDDVLGALAVCEKLAFIYASPAQKGALTIS